MTAIARYPLVMPVPQGERLAATPQEYANCPHQNAKRDYGNRDLHPQANIADRRLNAVTPWIRKNRADCLDRRGCRSLPPCQQFRRIDPTADITRQDGQGGPKPEEMRPDAQPGF